MKCAINCNVHCALLSCDYNSYHLIYPIHPLYVAMCRFYDDRVERGAGIRRASLCVCVCVVGGFTDRLTFNVSINAWWWNTGVYVTEAAKTQIQSGVKNTFSALFGSNVVRMKFWSHLMLHAIYPRMQSVTKTTNQINNKEISWELLDQGTNGSLTYEPAFRKQLRSKVI